MIKRFQKKLTEIVGAQYKDKKYLLAVSGGADSSVLTHFFNATKLNYSIAHCNFHLRGEDSDRDMKFVQKMAENLHAELFVKEFDTLSLQKNSGKSVEMVARDLRYAWFQELATDFDFIVTAHNCNDDAETEILNICRGAVLKGLCSIPQKNGKIIRPMLTFSAKEIREFATNNDIDFVEDFTNRDEKIVRNRIRHSVIPILNSINPQFLSTFSRNKHILTQQFDFYKDAIYKEIERITKISTDGATYIDKNKLKQSSYSQLILFEILNKFGFANEISEKILETADLQSGKKFYSQTHVLVNDRKYFIIEKIGEDNFTPKTIENLEELRKFFTIEEHFVKDLTTFDKNPNIFYISEEKLKFPLEIRKWRSGDYFFPLGNNGKKKLSDFFTDKKIDILTKEKLKLLCSENRIMWIIGLRSDERFKVEKNSEKYYKIIYSD